MKRTFRDRKGERLVPEVVESAGRWEVVAPLSSVRLGETPRNGVKSQHNIDYPKWSTVFVSKSERECRWWLDRYERVVLKLCIPYEVW
jgi:hypothetical protein